MTTNKQHLLPALAALAAVWVVSSCGSSPSVQTQQSKSYHLQQLPAGGQSQPLRTLHISTPNNGSANVTTTEADATPAASQAAPKLGSSSANNSKTGPSSAKKKAK